MNNGVKTLSRLSPSAILTGTFLVFLGPFLIVELFPAQLDRAMDKSLYLVFHNFAEFFSIMVSLSVFSVGWFTYDQSKDRHALFLSTAFLAVGLLDFMHTMSNAAMPDFITPNSTNKSTQFWIAARLLQASAFLVSAFIYSSSRSRWLTRKVLLTVMLALTGLVFTGVVFFSSHLPATAIPGTGLTPLKRYLEFLVIVLLAASAVAYWKRMRLTGERSLITYLAAFIICMFSEGVFASYKTGFDTYNVLGHIYKIAAFLLIYRGVFVTSVKKPYGLLLETHENLLRERITREELEKEVTERTRAEEALRQSELRYRTVADNTYDFEFWIDPEGRFLYASPSCERIYGREQSQFLNDPGLRRGTVHPDDLASFDQHVADEQNKRTPGELEFRILRPDGAPRWLAHACQPIFDEQGRYRGVRGSCRDITDRRNAEFALRELESRASALINAADESILLFGLDGVIRAANTTAAARLGKGVDEVIGTKWTDHMPSGVAELRQEKADEVVRTRGPVRFEDQRAGIYFDHRCYPVYDRAGVVNAIAVFSSDITERKRMEAENAYLASFPRLNPNPIVETDSSGKIIFCNPATAKVLESLGVDRGNAAVFLPSDLKLLLECWDSSTETTQYCEIELKNRTFGEYLHFSPQLKTVRIYAHDISELKQAEDAAKRHMQELKNLNEDLARFNSVAVDRELRMIDLKKEINALCGPAGELPRYPLNFEEEQP
jgi:PAS domain S-box-containing protein